MKTIVLLMLVTVLLAGGALAEPMTAWTTREVETFSRPDAGAQDGGLVAAGGRMTWMDTQDGWAHVKAEGGYECYVPADALTTDRVFDLAGQPTRNAQWPYAGEIRIAKDGAMRVVIRMAEGFEDMAIFGGAELLRFEVVDEATGGLVCTAEPDLSLDPVVYTGEGVCGEARALVVRPVLRHDGYSVEIQW